MTTFSTTALWHKINTKTKPVGALGQLERLAAQIATVQQTLRPRLRHPAVVVLAADHGLAQAGVSAYPPAVTWQMVQNFLRGGAAINVFCRQHGLQLQLVDAGVGHDFTPTPHLTDCKVGRGTANCLEAPAMTPDQWAACQTHGRALAEAHLQRGCNVLGFGEMGIGNTAVASLLMSALCQLPVAECTGRGTGLSDAQLARKVDILQTVQARRGVPTGPGAALQAYGGFEIAQMAVAMATAAAGGALVLVDGFIATVAWLLATRLTSGIADRAVFCHLSDERGHARLLDYLGGEPLLRLGLRLGEGTGCALAYPLLQSAVAFLDEMASFDEAGVSDRADEN